MLGIPQSIQQAQQLQAMGRGAEAEGLLRQCIAQVPTDPDARRALGLLLLNRGAVPEAVEYLRSAAQSAPARADVWYDFGMCLAAAEQFTESAAALERALSLAPQALQIHELLAQVLLRNEQPRKACAVLSRAMQLAPGNTLFGQGYIIALKACGQVAEAAQVADTLALRHPGDPELLMLAAWQATYWEKGDPLQIRQYLDRRGRLLAPKSPPVRFPNAPDPERRLRVGFLCQDIRRDSPIARFVAAPLLNLDRSQFELLGYCTQPTREHMDPRLLGAVGGRAGGWLDVSGADDAALLQRLRGDQLDILVETAGNTAGNRQPALAWRAAPVQVTCIGDPRTTGNPAIDYRVVDDITDPRGSPTADRACSERLTRLEGTFLCYEPHGDAPPPRPPADAAADAAAESITFGSFNIHDKTGPAVIALWARILTQVPGSRLVLASLGLRNPDLREHFLTAFRSGGIDPSRIDMQWEVPEMRDHLLRYHQIDIALDTFPYNGTTTTCDALWMGVPVVTLLGSWHAARVGASLLTSVGLAEYIARDQDHYVQIAADLARDRSRLADLHRTLRARMESSRLLDAAAYGRTLGTAYREMWRAWCKESRLPAR